MYKCLRVDTIESAPHTPVRKTLTIKVQAGHLKILGLRVYALLMVMA